MVRITITEEQRQQLLAAGDEIELCDESGRLLARATPIPPLRDIIKSMVPEGWELPPDFDEEEIKRISRSDERGISTEELVKKLQGEK